MSPKVDPKSEPLPYQQPGVKRKAKSINRTMVFTVTLSFFVVIIAVTLIIPARSKKTPGMEYSASSGEVSVSDFGSYHEQDSAPVSLTQGSSKKGFFTSTSSTKPSTVRITDSDQEPKSLQEPHNSYRPENNQAYRSERIIVDNSGLSANIKAEFWTDSPAKSSKTQYNQSGVGAPGSYGQMSTSSSGGNYANDVADSIDEQRISFAKQTISQTDVIKATGNGYQGMTVTAGTIIPAFLTTAINTDYPGQILARVSENIYDSTNKYVLIPQGTKLIANYNSVIRFGASSVQISWSTLKRDQDGYTVNLGNMPGTDPTGQSGVAASVDSHILNNVLAFAVGILTTVVNAEIINTKKLLYNSEQTAILDQANGYANDLAGKVSDQALAQKPTLRIPSGTKVDVFVTNDMVLKPFKVDDTVVKYSLK